LGVASSPGVNGQTPEVLPQPGSQELTQGILQAIKDSNFAPPIEVTDVLKAPVNSSDNWIICIRGTPPAGPRNRTYTVFFKQQYTRSRYSADYDGCGGQQYHPFVDPAKIPPPAPVPK
jgi:hypothetical protein